MTAGGDGGARRPTELDVREATVVRVVDGDTLDVRVGARTLRVRVRGIDAAETAASDKAVVDRASSGLSPQHMRALGEEAKAWLRHKLPVGTRVFVHLQPTRSGPTAHVHNDGRLLAFVSIASPDGEDVAAAMLGEGYTLVWPRTASSRRYAHPRSLAYVERCARALETRPGLWARGLDAFCPRVRAGTIEGGSSLCHATCLPAGRARPR